jgi:hypothetical protein
LYDLGRRVPTNTYEHKVDAAMVEDLGSTLPRRSGMAQYPTSEFDVDLYERKVTHRPSGIWFSFYEYQNEADWLKTDSVFYRENPDWDGDRSALAASAKAAAIAAGMKARKPVPAKVR